jgi:predicted TIM-barrel enzyme
VPCLYYDHITPQLAEKYRPFVDGILFPYRHESGKRNLSQWDTLASELARVRERFGSGVPVFVDVYATRHSQLKDSTAEYVEQVMNIGRRTADGVLIFCHQCQDSSPEKYQVIKDLFNRWASEDAKHRLAGMGVRP